MKMIKMHQVILSHLRRIHQVSDNSCIGRNINAKSVLDAPYRSKSMHRGTHAADTLGKRPRIPRIAPLEDHLNTAPHRTTGVSILNHIAVVQRRLYSQVPLNTGNWINNYFFGHELTPGLCFIIIKLV